MPDFKRFLYIDIQKIYLALIKCLTYSEKIFINDNLCKTVSQFVSIKWYFKYLHVYSDISILS